MTVSSTPSVKTYTGNGASVNFPTVFQFIAEGDIKVYLDGVLKTITTHYTVTGGAGSTGTVTFVTAPASDVAIVLQRLVDYVQETDYADFDGNPAATTETQFDLVVMQAQQLLDATGRALSVPVGSDFDPEVAISGNEGKYLRINDAGDAFDFTSTVDTEVVSVSSFAETVVDDTSAASMRQTLLFPAQSASKRGSILVQNDTDDGYEQITSQGTTGQVLTSAGADALPTFTTLASTSTVLLQTQTASASASIAFSSTYLTTTYKSYIVEILNIIPATDTANLYLTASTDNGSNYLAGTSYSYHNMIPAAGSVSYAGVQSEGTAQIPIASNLGSGTGENLSGKIMLFNPLDATVYKIVTFHITAFDAGGVPTAGVGNCTIETNTAINNIKFAMSTGNIASGTFKLYGVL